MSSDLALSTFMQYLTRVQVPIQNVVFKEKKVHLDGYTFQNCAFVGCHLDTSVGNFVLEGCYIGPGTVLHFSADALKVVKLATLIDWNKIDPQLKAERHPDTSVTIK